LRGDVARRNGREMNAGPRLRRGTGADANLAAEVYLRARRRAVPEISPLAHPDDEVRQWMRRVLDEQEAIDAVRDGGWVISSAVPARRNPIRARFQRLAR